MQGGKSGELVRRLKQALAGHGARVLDATGTAALDKQRFLSALEAEKNRSHAASAFDVMVGIQRVLEGTDWPVCSAVYCVGMPGSLNTVVQFLGRAMRLKADDYPAEHRDRARLVFFVPCGGGTALAGLSIDHSRSWSCRMANGRHTMGRRLPGPARIARFSRCLVSKGGNALRFTIRK